MRFAAQRPHAFAVIYDPTVCVPGQPTETMAPLIAAEEQLVGEVVAELLGGAADERAVAAFAAAAWGVAHGLAQLAQVGHLTLDEALAAVDAFVERTAPAH